MKKTAYDCFFFESLAAALLPGAAALLLGAAALLLGAAALLLGLDACFWAAVVEAGLDFSFAADGAAAAFFAAWPWPPLRLALAA